MASIRKRTLKSGGTAYLVRFRGPNGKERSQQFPTKRQATHFAHTIELDRTNGTVVDPRQRRMTVQAWYERWWPTVTGIRPSTRTRDEIYYRCHIAPVYGDVPLGRIDRTDLREFVATLSRPKDEGGKGLAPATVQKVMQMFNKLMQAAVEDRRLSHNPVDRLPLPKIERQEMRFLDADELWRLADAINPQYRGFVLLGGYGGLRLGEMLALRWRRLDLATGNVDVAETLVDLRGHLSFGPPKTKAAVRTVMVPSFVLDELGALREGAGDEDLVFRSPEGHPLRQSLFRRREWNPAVKAASLAPLRIHDLRHTAISLWIAAGANAKQVAVRAGHTSVSVVLDRYGHLYPNQDRELVAALEQRARSTA